MSCVSWLVLERRALGELSAAERAPVDAHVASCPACSSCAAAIHSDVVALPPLPVVLPRRRPWWIAPALAAGLATLFVVSDPRGVVKGEPLVISVVDAAGRARARVPRGEPLMIAVSCRGSGPFDVAVYDGDGVSFPIDRGRVSCGGLAPGALTLTRAGAARVCGVLGELPTREVMRAGPPKGAACVELDVE